MRSINLHWLSSVNIWLIIIFLSCNNLFQTVLASDDGDNKISQSGSTADFFKFSAGLFKWTAFAKSLQGDSQSRFQIYQKFPKSKLPNLEKFFEENRKVLLNLKRDDLNRYKGKDIVPDLIYQSIRRFFRIRDAKEPLDGQTILIKLVGGDFDLSDGQKPAFHAEGFLDSIESFDMNKWAPIKRFLDNFRDTITVDSSLSQQVGRTLQPLTLHYYRYMDPISRLKIFKELAVEYNQMNFNSKLENDLDQMAIKVFQNSGPVLIKLLQQLQEEVVGESPLHTVLAGLKKAKPMDPKEVEAMVAKELRRVTGKKTLKGFKFKEKPLGIASIGQAHMFSYEENKFVVKILKDQVDEIFDREKKMLTRLLASEPDFDKGMKQRIKNTNDGIQEEVNFKFERRNLTMGDKLYTNPGKHIFTVAPPSEFRRPEEEMSKNIMFMSLAKGESLGTIMDRGNPDELILAYKAVQNLYYDYLKLALDGSKKENFYHGDLHRENIFFDVETNSIHLIDFGNAGTIKPEIQKYIHKMLNFTKKLPHPDEATQDKFIVELGSVIEKLVEDKDLSKPEISEKNQLTHWYFRVCFDPEVRRSDKIFESDKIGVRRSELIKRKESLVAEFEKGFRRDESLRKRIEAVQDNIDYILAFQLNCFSNSPDANNILPTLVNPHASPSDKLSVIFQELLRNGVAMPKEVIFFNKSKLLLEGILKNIAQNLDEKNYDYEKVDSETIFNHVLEAISG